MPIGLHNQCLPGGMGVGAHCDSGFLTLLWQERSLWYRSIWCSFAGPLLLDVDLCQ